MRRISLFGPLALVFAFASATFAQTFDRSAAVVSEDVASQMPAFSFIEGPKFTLNFRGTSVAPAASGTAKVEFQDGRSRVSADVRELPGPDSLGPYTTYVLWAVTPQGQPSNLGALDVRSGRGELDAATPLAQFGLMVTAEPHFAVAAPSKSIVLQNFTRDERLRQTTIHTLTERADYSSLARQPADPRGRTPLDLIQERYALAIAQGVSAAQYAPESFSRAEALARKAETAQASKKYSERKQAALLARDAVEALEAARRDAIAGREVSDQKARDEARAEADRAAAEKAAAEAKEREAASSAAAAKAAAETASAEAEVKARADLLERLNKALPTTETERGLVAQISGVQFSSGGAKLNASAQNSLARFAGILLSYPEIRFMVEGHTDNVGSETTNTALSLQRAITVRDFLIAQGLAASSIDVKGMGSNVPASDNTTAAGRAMNRRVEIVMSGGLLARK